ncbi:unnamed protein product [Calypogeia fissa]
MEPGEFITLVGVTIFVLWGLKNGSFVYEKCNVPLADDKACALGIIAKRNQLQSPSSSLHPNARGQANHNCAPMGKGVHMFFLHAIIKDEVLEIWEDAKMQLLGMSGQEFFRRYHNVVQQGEYCQRVMEETWMITIWRPKEKVIGRAARVINFS